MAEIKLVKKKKTKKTKDADTVVSSPKAAVAISPKRAAATPAVVEEEPAPVLTAARVKKKLKKKIQKVVVEAEEAAPVAKKPKKSPAPAPVAVEAEEAEEAVDASAAAALSKSLKVVVGGVAFSASEGSVRSFFEQCGGVDTVDLPNNSNGKPKGIAFVIFSDRAGVEAALTKDGVEFEGRKLFIRIYSGWGRDATKTGTGSNMGPGDANTAFIKGLPYHVDENKLWKDFGECGEITNIRMPKREDGKSRSLAFIKFGTPDGLEAALKYDSTDYDGRTIWVTKASIPGKGKDGKGKADGKGKGKGKGKEGKSKEEQES